MSMHLEKPYLTTTKYGSKGSKVANTVAKRKAIQEHDAWLKQNGLHPDQLKLRKKNIKNDDRRSMPSLGDARKSLEKLSNNLHVSGGYRTGVMDNLHKETAEVRKAILDKANRVAPAYSKGGYQYITPGTDLTDIGKKK